MAEVTFPQYVNAGERGKAYAEQCEAAATTLVEKLIGAATVDTAIKQQAIFTTAANFYQRRLRLTELNGYADGTVQYTPDRPTRDPLDAARYILAEHLGPGIS